ncbi:exosome complex component RRP43 [Lepeophtheirus salmonis]|uniref:exosome complex component RRP43 n=1 Tax=Lepeophtheirus salmonis TaxID=72036 RepID=UPI001AE990A1|nr:exosome complex component RRP43-like [Lepeophtheirus salmonis]
MSASEVFRRVQPKEYFNQHVDKGLRLDGREGGLDSLRPLSISSGSITTADGSSIIKKGNTIVICGITLQIATPTEEHPNRGFIVPHVDLPTMCNPRNYKSRGQISDEIQVLSKFVMDILENSGVINLDTLCIVPGEYAWVLKIDFSCLNHDGNVKDAIITALILALKEVKMPKVETFEEEDSDKTLIKVVKNKYSQLQLQCIPVSVTMAIMEGDKILVDPTEEEESFAPDSITLVLDAEDEMCYFAKLGGNPISDELLDKITNLARQQALTVRKLINKN